MTGLRCQVEDSAKRGEIDSDAMYHLQVAQATLNERYSKLQRKNAELQKRLDQTMLKLVRRSLLCDVCVIMHTAISVTCIQVYLGTAQGFYRSEKTGKSQGI